jgi:hypothetical protein
MSQYLTYSIATPEKCMASSLLIKGTSGNGTFLTDSTHCINIEFLSSGNNDVGYISEGAISKLTGKFKISVCMYV